jgi:hypothetical protein
MDCKIQLPRTWLVALLGYDFFTLGPAGLLFVHTPLMRSASFSRYWHPTRSARKTHNLHYFFLGIELNSITMTARLPDDKLLNLAKSTYIQCCSFLEFCYILKWIRSLHIGNGFTNPLTKYLVLYYLIIIILFIIKNLILQRLSFNTPRLLISKQPFTLYIVIYSYN